MLALTVDRKVVIKANRDNNILPLSLHSPSIIRDEHETDPAKRYKALGYLGGGYGVAYSAEGLKWTLYAKNPVLPGGDTCTLSQDPRTHEYLAFHKLYRSHRDHQRRLVYLSRSKDMQNWTPQKLVMAPDKIDDAQTRVEGGLYLKCSVGSGFSLRKGKAAAGQRKIPPA